MRSAQYVEAILPPRKPKALAGEGFRILLAAVARPTTVYGYYQPETKTAAPGGKFQVD